MKMRYLLLLALCLFFGQQLSANSEERGHVHRVPPRKEIRHKIKNHPLDNTLQQETTRASGEYIMTEFPTEGEVRGVVLLVAFQDVAFSLPDDSIRTILQNRYDGDHYTEYVEHQGYSEVDGGTIGIRCTIPGSARDYFRDQSFGRFVPRFDVVGPVTLDNPRAYYGANTSSGNDKNTKGMITEACRKAYEQGLADFTKYDGDGDGTVDFVYVVYAGSDEAQTGIEECVWAHASSVSLTLGGMRLQRYACSGELFVDLPGLPAGIGTFVHEFSHILGLPDFYNTQKDDFTMDVWSVMDYGMYNRGGFVPCAYTAFERYSLGWLPMQTLDAPASMSIGTTDEEGRGYRIFTADLDTNKVITEADTASFYLIENIRKEGWNRYAYAEGLLISEVTYKASAWQNNTVNVGTNHRHCIVPADNVYDYNSPETQLFGTANHEFTLSSTPASRTQFGAAMDKPLTGIRYDAETGKTTFHFRGGSVSGISLNQTSATLVEGETFTLIVTVSPSDVTAPKVTWSSSNESVATVDSTGKVTAVAEGVVTITAKVGEKTATCEVIVEKKVIDVSGIVLSQSVATLVMGESITLIATVSPDDATDKTIVWSSSDESVATVDNGVVTAVAEGTAIISAMAGDMTAACVVTVSLADSIDQIANDSMQLIIYDMMGRKFTDVEKLRRGVYIVNGRKMIVK